MRARPILLAALLATAACGPRHGVRGVVKTMPSETAGGDYVPGTPVPGARVALACPDREPLDLGETDPEGHFQHTPDDAIPTDCAIRISRRGYEPRAIPVADVCVHPGDSCDWLSVTARLLPEDGSR